MFYLFSVSNLITLNLKILPGRRLLFTFRLICNDQSRLYFTSVLLALSCWRKAAGVKLLAQSCWRKAAGANSGVKMGRVETHTQISAGSKNSAKSQQFCWIGLEYLTQRFPKSAPLYKFQMRSFIYLFSCTDSS